MIRYKIEAKANPLNRDEVKYYPQIVPASIINIEMLIKHISERTSLTSSDVRAVIDALEYEMIDGLENGNIIRMGSIGTFRPTLKSEGASTAKEARSKGSNLVKSLNVKYMKSKELKSSLKISRLRFSLATNVHNATDADSESKEE